MEEPAFKGVPRSCHGKRKPMVEVRDTDDYHDKEVDIKISMSERRLTLEELDRLHREIDADMQTTEVEVHRLYFKEDLTQREVAKKLGIDRVRIWKMFKKHGWIARPAGPRREEADPNEVRRLYFDEGLTQKEVAEALGLKGASPIKRVFNEMKWKSRGRWGPDSVGGRRHFETDDERELAKKERYEKRLRRMHRLREALFGAECGICGTSKDVRTLAIHRKDFVEHDQNFLWKVSNLRTLNPDEWVALCVACHRGVHWMHEQHGAEWKDIEQHQKHNDTHISQVRELYELSNREEAPKRNEHDARETIGELRKRLFGEECSMCGSDNRRLAIHRKDGSPHSKNFLRFRENLENINTDEWTLLCQKCHRYVHWAMDNLRMKWNDFA